MVGTAEDYRLFFPFMTCTLSISLTGLYSNAGAIYSFTVKFSWRFSVHN